MNQLPDLIVEIHDIYKDDNKKNITVCYVHVAQVYVLILSLLFVVLIASLGESSIIMIVWPVVSVSLTSRTSHNWQYYDFIIETLKKCKKLWPGNEVFHGGFLL